MRLVATVCVVVLVCAVSAMVLVIALDAAHWNRVHQEQQVAELDKQIQDVRAGKRDTIVLYGEHADALLRRLRHLSGLKVLCLDRTDATSTGLGYVRDFPDLRVLQIISGTGIGDDSMDNLVGHPTVQELLLFNTQVTDRGVAILQKVPRLTTLTLKWDARSSCPITDNSLAAIAEIPGLQTLTISGEWYTPQALETLKRRRPNLKITERNKGVGSL